MDTENFILYIKQMIFKKALQKMLKQDLILQLMKFSNIHCLKKKIRLLPKGKNKKVIGLRKHE